ncbi:F-box protein [Sporobolomyces koalae]|uniref:F-box protein n=1 Tax=Sporobolomyces koalae TaxID=500713 RepID=UPI00317A5E84
MPPKKRKELEEAYDPTVERSSRHRKTAKSTKKKTRAIKPVMNLPLDVVWELCTYLDFSDLFALSMSCRSIRAMLTQPNASSLLKAARLRNEIAELALPMDDLSYAALLFSKNCYFCKKKSGGKLDPHLRTRICASCKKDKIVYLTEADRKGYNPYAMHLTRCTAYTFKPERGYGCFKPRLERISEDLNARFPQTVLHAPPYPAPHGTKLCNIRTDGDYARAIFSNPHNPELQMPQGLFQDWSFAQAKIRALKRRDIMTLEAWNLKAADDEAARKDKVRSDRFNEIKRRLLLDGYSRDDLWSQRFEQHKLVDCARPLTDRAWTTKVGPQLKALIEIIRLDPSEDEYEEEAQGDYGYYNHYGYSRYRYDEYDYISREEYDKPSSSYSSFTPGAGLRYRYSGSEHVYTTSWTPILY